MAVRSDLATAIKAANLPLGLDRTEPCRLIVVRRWVKPALRRVSAHPWHSALRLSYAGSLPGAATGPKKWASLSTTASFY